jgi:hypothetical protein
MAISAVIIDSSALRDVTREYVGLKTKHFATKFVGSLSLDHILAEVKGTQLLSLSRNSSRNARRQATKFRSELFAILKSHDVKVMGRIWVKSIGNALDPRTSYGYAVQDLARDFNHYLGAVDDVGIMIGDSREHRLNVQVAHSIFTQKWKIGGDAYQRILEVPMFAASDNHAGIQIADLVASTFMFPMAIAAYCSHVPGFVHSPVTYEHIRQQSGKDLHDLLYRYKDAKGFWNGGIHTSGRPAGASGTALFG